MKEFAKILDDLGDHFMAQADKDLELSALCKTDREAVKCLSRAGTWASAAKILYLKAKELDPE